MVRVSVEGTRDCGDDLLGVEGAQERASRRGRLLERLPMRSPMQDLCGDPILRQQVRGGGNGIIFRVRGIWLRQSIEWRKLKG